MVVFALHYVGTDAAQVDGVFDSWERADGARLALSQHLRQPTRMWSIVELELNEYRG